MTSSFVVEGYAVVHGEVPNIDSGVPAAFWVCSVSMTAAPGRLDDGITTLLSRVDQVRKLSEAAVGTLLLLPMVGYRCVALEYWVSDPSVAASESRVRRIDQQISRSSAFRSPVQREVFEVIEIV